MAPIATCIFRSGIYKAHLVSYLEMADDMQESFAGRNGLQKYLNVCTCKI